jgi:hypothetical protein
VSRWDESGQGPRCQLPGLGRQGGRILSHTPARALSRFARFSVVNPANASCSNRASMTAMIPPVWPPVGPDGTAWTVAPPPARSDPAGRGSDYRWMVPDSSKETMPVAGSPALSMNRGSRWTRWSSFCMGFAIRPDSSSAIFIENAGESSYRRTWHYGCTDFDEHSHV